VFRREHAHLNFVSRQSSSGAENVERADLETVITDLMSGQYSDPVRVVAFNTAERWAEDVSEDIAREIQRRVDLAGDELPPSIEAFVETHAGPSPQLSLRLN
jgi:hypothetical protein